MEGENHISLTDLIKKLNAGLESVNSGEASIEKVQEMLSLSRELHERLVVLRFKAFEASKSDEGSDDSFIDDTVSEAQIDLIDSINEVSLSEKHQLKPLSSVREGLTILEMANYTSILFSNDESCFNDLLDQIDLCETASDATELFRSSIKPKGIKEDIEQARLSFEERIPRIFS